MIVLRIILSAAYWLYLGINLCVFHVLQLVAIFIGNEQLRQFFLKALNMMLLFGLWVVLARIKFVGFDRVPMHGPLVIVSNHQNIFDIPAVIWVFRKFNVQFIAKKSLGKGIPSVSLNLKKSGSVLISKNTKDKAIADIGLLGEEIQRSSGVVCIFPEGTRSEGGKIQHFHHKGLEALLSSHDEITIVPFAIDGHNRLKYKDTWMFSFGSVLTYSVLRVINYRRGDNVTEITLRIEETIKNVIKKPLY